MFKGLDLKNKGEIDASLFLGIIRGIEMKYLNSMKEVEDKKKKIDEDKKKKELEDKKKVEEE